MAPKAPQAYRYWKFEPDPILSIKHHTPSKIDSIRTKLLAVMPPEGAELDHASRVNLHPLIRDRLPAGSRRADFQRVAESLEHARDLSAAGLSGPSFYPTVIDTGKPISSWQLRDSHQVRAFVDVPGEESRLFMPLAYVTPRTDGHYFIEAFGMQHSDPRSAVQRAAKEETGYHDIRDDLPEGTRQVFDLHAPALGLALTSALLRKAGAEKITLPGNELQWWRKGTKRPQSYADLTKKAASSEYSPEVRARLKSLLANWEKLKGPDVRRILRELRTLSGKKRAFANAHGIPKVILERNYMKVPRSLGAREITAEEAIGPNPLSHLKFEWGLMEPEKAIRLPAYDLNVPRLDSLQPFIKPMTKAEVSAWKKKMKSHGLLVDKITGEDSSPA